MTELRKLVQFGNKKLPKTTMIFNIGPASMCPSRALGMCQLDRIDGCSSDRCYAMNAEQRYGKPNVLPYRMRQMEWWDGHSAAQIAEGLLEAAGRRKVTALRLNEAGDFRHWGDYIKAVCVANSLAASGVRTYCYTARRDLVEKLSSKPVYLIINGSGWMAHNKYVIVPKGTAKQYISEHPGARRCAGDCRVCKFCLEPKGRTIVNEVH